MREKILSILKKTGIKEYNLYEETRESVELFFIKHGLDLSRSKCVEEIRLRIYRDFTENGKRYMGSSDVYIYPKMDEAELTELIAEAYKSAGYVRNPYFYLAEPVVNSENTETVDNLMDNAIKTSEALFKGEEISGTNNAFINSAEIFANKKTVRITTSNNTDVSYSEKSITGEFVVQCIQEDNDVELYQDFEYDVFDGQALTEKCKNALNSVKDRAVAVKTMEDFTDYPIILTDSYVGELLNFYMNKANAAYIYPGYSSYKRGEAIHAYEDSEGEKLTLYGIPKSAFSDEGVKMERLMLIEDGTVKNIHGNLPFLSYLREKQTGVYTKKECTNGTATMEELCRGKYILVKNFSDFQIDAFDGHFGGEFRLAYLCEGDKVSIITGGTVTGNLIDAGNSLVFSKEKYRDGNYYGPAAVKINIKK